MRARTGPGPHRPARPRRSRWRTPCARPSAAAWAAAGLTVKRQDGGGQHVMCVCCLSLMPLGTKDAKAAALPQSYTGRYQQLIDVSARLDGALGHRLPLTMARTARRHRALALWLPSSICRLPTLTYSFSILTYGSHVEHPRSPRPSRDVRFYFSACVQPPSADFRLARPEARARCPPLNQLQGASSSDVRRQ